MGRVTCDDSYKEDMKAYTEEVLKKYGVSSNSAEREVMILAAEGNTVALKLYADMIFYKRILRKNAYRDAFSLYLRSAGISVDCTGAWKGGDRSYPLSYWSLAFCLVNYRRGSFMLECEPIDIIERMTLNARLSLALELACASLEHAVVPGALNLIGRILYEASKDDGLCEAMKDVIKECIPGSNSALTASCKSNNDKCNCKHLDSFIHKQYLLVFSHKCGK